MTETNKMLEECANYLLNHCFVLGQRSCLVSMANLKQL